MPRSKSEALEGSKHTTEPGPDSYSKVDMDNFTYSSYYDYLLDTFPTLMHVLAGTMMSHQGPEEIEVRLNETV